MTETAATTDLELVIGLEVHCQLGTASKLFCSCKASSFGAVANTNVCPVCTGQPGTLPVLNGRAVELAYLAALALECRLREESIFARKNYFYPDLPKGYQISQYEEPFSRDGRLEIAGPPPKTVRIHRIHLEEDAGKLLHDLGGAAIDGSLVDFNRAGTPLIEIVSEPDLRSPEEAHQYLTALKAVLQYAGVSNCDMEKGEMRCDANVSVRPRGAAKFGTRSEIKNLNSLRGVRDAVEYEFRRQGELVAEGGRVVQETRLWDAERRVTAAMRSKEEAHDYRYFPDPDLVPLTADPALVARIKAAMPELPAARRRRIVKDYGLSEYDAGVLTAHQSLVDYFEECLKPFSEKKGESAKLAANYITTRLMGLLHEKNIDINQVRQAPITPAHMASVVGLTQSNMLSTKLGNEVLGKVWETGDAPEKLIKDLGLSQVSDERQLAEWVEAAMAENPKAVEDMKAGKQRAVGAIVGSVMKRSKGKANPEVVNRLIQERLR